MRNPTIRIVREDSNRSSIESLRYAIEVVDERNNLVEVLGRLADLDAARAAFAAACAEYPAKRIFLCDGARGLARSDEPPEWLTAYRTIPVFKENP